MIAFKKYSQILTLNKLQNIPDDFPYEMQKIELSQKDFFESLGYQILNESDYETYIQNFNLDNYKKVPASVTPRQIRLALLKIGISLSGIESFLNNLSDPIKSEALIWWEYSVEFQRNNLILNQLAPQLGLNKENLDDLFILASTL